MRKELLQWRRDRGIAALVVTLAALVLVAALAGSWTATRRSVANGTALRGDYARWLAQPPRDPHSASHFGVSVFHTPSRLAALDPGVSPYAGASLFLEAHKQNEPALPDAADTGAAARLGQLHLATALQVWVPLVIIALAAGAFASEREHGTLAQLMSLGLRPATLAAGKMLAAAVAVLIVTLPGVTVAVLAAALADPQGPWPADAALRLLVLASAYATYFALWIAATVIVSAAVRSWRVAAAILIAAWCLTTIVAPRAAIDRARIAHPLPSRATVEREITDSRLQRGRTYQQDKAALLREYGVASEKDLPVDFSVLWLQRTDARDNALIDRYAAQRDGVYRAERDAYVRAAWLSPAIALDLLSSAAAGTDDAHYRAFVRQAETYRREMMRILNGALVRRPGDARPRGTAALWAQLPPFTFTVPPLGDEARTIAQAAAALTAWLLAVALAGARLLRRLTPLS